MKKEHLEQANEMFFTKAEEYLPSANNSKIKIFKTNFGGQMTRLYTKVTAAL